MSAWRRWVALLDRREPGVGLAIFRIAIGLCVLGTFGSVLVHDLADLIWVGQRYGGYRAIGEGSALVALLGGPTPAVVHGLLATVMAGGAALVLGIGGRLAAFATLQAAVGLTWLNGQASGSYDDLLTNALWLLVLARSQETLSLACRLRTGRWTSDALVPAWPRWLAAFQLVLMYASTGSQKLSSHWVPGGDLSALYYALQQPSWQRIDMQWLAPFFPVTQALTLLTWTWEVGSPLVLLWLWLRHRRSVAPLPEGRLRRLLLARDLRVPFALFGVGMHLGILLSMEVSPFSELSLAFYPMLWHPDELQGMARRIAANRLTPAVR